ncbi:hypothetical protein J6590_056691 [Homalodisca vitripennis]|nr:hypothetical protein J6590_056691 [Homalodisca vitripennis]
MTNTRVRQGQRVISAPGERTKPSSVILVYDVILRIMSQRWFREWGRLLGTSDNVRAVRGVMNGCRCPQSPSVTLFTCRLSPQPQNPSTKFNDCRALTFGVVRGTGVRETERKRKIEREREGGEGEVSNKIQVWCHLVSAEHRRLLLATGQLSVVGCCVVGPRTVSVMGLRAGLSVQWTLGPPTPFYTRTWLFDFLALTLSYRTLKDDPAEVVLLTARRLCRLPPDSRILWHPASSRRSALTQSREAASLDNDELEGPYRELKEISQKEDDEDEYVTGDRKDRYVLCEGGPDLESWRSGLEARIERISTCTFWEGGSDLESRRAGLEVRIERIGTYLAKEAQILSRGGPAQILSREGRYRSKDINDRYIPCEGSPDLESWWAGLEGYLSRFGEPQARFFYSYREDLGTPNLQMEAYISGQLQ